MNNKTIIKKAIRKLSRLKISSKRLLLVCIFFYINVHAYTISFYQDIDKINDIYKDLVSHSNISCTEQSNFYSQLQNLTGKELRTIRIGTYFKSIAKKTSCEKSFCKKTKSLTDSLCRASKYSASYLLVKNSFKNLLKDPYRRNVLNSNKRLYHLFKRQ